MLTEMMNRVDAREEFLYTANREELILEDLDYMVLASNDEAKYTGGNGLIIAVYNDDVVECVYGYSPSEGWLYNLGAGIRNVKGDIKDILRNVVVSFTLKANF